MTGPGNVRELEHVVERSLIIHDNDKGILHFVLPGESMGEMISFPLSSAAERNDKTNEFVLNPSEGGHWPTLKEVEERHIRETLKKTKGKMLGVDGRLHAFRHSLQHPSRKNAEYGATSAA